MRLVLLALLFPLIPRPSYAFPEMVRHHYVNCNSCHLDPGGGGLLTEYGRGMSAEVLSTWHYENEALFLHGALKPEKVPTFLHIGGDIRATQVHRETRRVREGRYILMQASLAAAVTVGPVTAAAAFFEPDRLNHVHGAFTSFYLLGSLTDTWQIKAGRFLPAFGLREPRHILSTRQALGFGYGSERDALEAHFSGEQWHLASGWSVSRPESAVGERERAFYLQGEKFLADRFRIGLSLWKGESGRRLRWLASLHGILGFSERCYLSTETTWESRQAKSPGAAWETGLSHFGRFGYELWQGFQLTALEDIGKANVAQPESLTLLLGAGPVWYPRPHLELELVFSQRKILRQSPDFEDYAYLMLHYYL